MIYFCYSKPSSSVLAVMRALGGHKLPRFDGLDFWIKKQRTCVTDSVIVCWGTHIPEIEGVRVLNTSINPRDRYKDYVAMLRAGLNAISVRLPKEMEHLRAGNYVPADEDKCLLGETYSPNFWTPKYNFTSEFVVHSFNGRSIKSGVKVPKEGFEPSSEQEWKPNTNHYHPWIKSSIGGWTVDYDLVVPPAVKTLAHRAVKALGLTFGMVTIGESEEYLVIIKVNQAPRCEGSVTDAYVLAITRWIANVK